MNPCLHGGRCINSPGSFSCQCSEGWMGALCDIGKFCTSKRPCHLHSYKFLNGKHLHQFVICLLHIPKQCVGIVDIMHDIYTTAQAVFKFELNSSADVNECLQFPCRNGATCKNLNGTFECICPEGYSGTLCTGGIHLSLSLSVSCSCLLSLFSLLYVLSCNRM